MPTIVWNKYSRCLIAQGFTIEQIAMLGEIIPYGFADRLRATVLDPRTFRLSVGEKEEKNEGDKQQMTLFNE